MEAVREQLVNQLVEAVEELPTEKVYEVIDFVGYLQNKYNQQKPARGSAEALLDALDKHALVFDPGELDALLADIDRMRDLDTDKYVELPD